MRRFVSFALLLAVLFAGAPRAQAAEFLVTSFEHTVTQSGTPILGSPFPNDVEALQAAVNAAVSGDEIQLREGAAGKPFDLSVGARRILILAPARSLTFRGISTAGESHGSAVAPAPSRSPLQASRT